MDEDLLTRWHMAAQGLCALAQGLEGFGHTGVLGYFRRHKEALSAAPTWPPEVRTKLAASMPYHLYRDPRSHNPSRALVTKVVSLGHALVTGDATGIPGAELREILQSLEARVPEGVTDECLACLDVLRSCLSALPPPVDAPPPRTERLGDVVRHPFTFPWWRRAGSGREVPMRLATGTSTVECLDAEDAPVVLRLRRPDGGWLDVRRSGRTWFRPVSAPGTWEGMGLDAFVSAAIDAPAWGDNPFVPWPTGRMMPLSLADFVPVRDEVADGHAADRARDELGSLESAKRIALIDGVVHRETDEPVLTLVVTRDDEFCPGWRLGQDRTSYDAASTFAGWHPGTSISPPSYKRGRERTIMLPPTCAAYVRDLVDAASHHSRERALGDEALPAPVGDRQREADRVGLYGRRYDKMARVMAEVDIWSPSGVMHALSTQARALRDEMAEGRAWDVRVNRLDPQPAGIVERRLDGLAVLIEQAAEGMEADEPDLDVLDGVCRELAIWCDGYDRRSMGLSEALLVRAARLTFDRFDLVRAAVPKHDPEDFATFVP